MASKTERKKRGFLNKEGRLDIPFLSLVLILLTIGLIMLFSASYAYSLEYYNSSFKFIRQQLIFAVLGLIAMYVLSRIDYHFWRKFGLVLYVLTVFMLGILLIMPPMIPDLGVKRWIVIGSFSFQPSEIAKIAIILFLTFMIKRLGRDIRNASSMFILLAVGAVTGAF
ncbi:MAG: FtsW/RodA/SpoVE family cell cycle protein, partial [Clostridia bacterium]|nr:FtsW/RodA/SpoVE family cell cycle protein [Clostridia bacterium]